jgi:hypothetical protein
MSLSPRLQRKLQETLGVEAAHDLVSLLEVMDANRGDVGELRHEMQLGFARIDARFEQQNTTFERVLREQTRFFFVAWAVILAAIIGIYAR